MQTWRRALMEIPEAQRLETALFWLEEMTGGEQNVAAVQRVYGLTHLEARVVAALGAAAPKALTKLQIYRVLYPLDDDVSMKIIEVLISKARRRLPAGAITTVRGAGYLMRAPLAAEPQRIPFCNHAPVNQMSTGLPAPRFVAKSIGPGQREARA